MKKMILTLVATMFSMGPAMAGSELKKEANNDRAATGETGYESVSYIAPRDERSKGELDVCRAVALAITQSAVLGETRDARLDNAAKTRKKITVRGNRLTLSYSRDLYSQQCYLAVGPVQKWKTVNGLWTGGRVNSRSIARTLAILKANGVKLKGFTISVSNERHLADAKRLVARLRLKDVAVVGLDKEKPNHATARFEHNK